MSFFGRVCIHMMMIMMIIMMNCYCGMVDRRKVSIISSRDHCQRSSPSQISDATSRIWTWFEPEFRLWWMKLCSSNNHHTRRWAIYGELYILFSCRSWHRCFPVNFAKYLRTRILQNICGRMLLNVLCANSSFEPLARKWLTSRSFLTASSIQL